MNGKKFRPIVGPDVRTSASACPTCKTILDGASGIGNRDAPQPGDYSVCVYCGTILRFLQSGFGFTAVAPQKVPELLATNYNLRVAYHAVQELLKNRPI